MHLESKEVERVNGKVLSNITGDIRLFIINLIFDYSAVKNLFGVDKVTNVVNFVNVVYAKSVKRFVSGIYEVTVVLCKLAVLLREGRNHSTNVHRNVKQLVILVGRAFNNLDRSDMTSGVRVEEIERSSGYVAYTTTGKRLEVSSPPVTTGVSSNIVRVAGVRVRSNGTIFVINYVIKKMCPPKVRLNGIANVNGYAVGNLVVKSGFFIR